MPLINVKKKDKYIYGVWKITESLNSLLNKIKLNKNDANYLSQISNEQRKKQSIAAKIILNRISNKTINIKYRENGAPFCTEYKNISISHSNIFSVTLISDEITGIDIQHKKTNIKNLKSKFINNIKIIGVPCCDKSLKRNGFDDILERVCHGEKFNRKKIAEIADGGLYKNIIRKFKEDKIK